MQHDVTLSRDGIVLRPLTLEDAPALRAVVDEETWSGMSVPLPRTDAEMAAHLKTMIGTDGLLAFAVEQAGALVGRTTFYDYVPGLRVEIGNTIYTRTVWGTALNPTAKLLLLTHAFEEMGVGRVALRCDSRNRRSHDAIRRLGATYEGTLRRFRPSADGSIADVDYFSVLADEWPAVRAGLESRLAGRASPQTPRVGR